jgi:hypothetical protein
MGTRVLATLLCALLLSAASFDFFAEASQKRFSAIFEFETSFISLDSLDDATEGGFPGRTVAWSPREKIIAKLMLGTTPRRIKFVPAAMADCVGIASSRQTFQDLLRFQEVYRI